MPRWLQASAVDQASGTNDFAAHGAMFFILVPALIGFVMGVNQVAVARAMAWPTSIIFWVGLSLLLWTGLYVVTLAMSRTFHT